MAGDQADRRARRSAPEYERAPKYVPGLACFRLIGLSTTPRSPTTTRSSRPGPSAIRRQDERRRPAHLRPRRPPLVRRLYPEAVFENTRVETTVRGARLPHPRPAAAGSGLAGRVRRRLRRRSRRADDDEPSDSSCPSSSKASSLESAKSAPKTRKPSHHGATAMARCLARWRPPASSSMTRSCARR